VGGLIFSIKINIDTCTEMYYNVSITINNDTKTKGGILTWWMNISVARYFT